MSETESRSIEPKLPWLTSLPPMTRFYAALGVVALLLVPAVPHEVPYLPHLLIGLAALSLFLSYAGNTKGQDVSRDLELIRRDIDELRKTVAPVSRDFETMRELIIELNGGRDDDSHLLLMAKKQALAADYDKAIATLNILATRAPNDPRVYSNLSYSYEAKGEMDLAIQFVSKAIELCSKTGSDKLARYLYHRARYFSKRAYAAKSESDWQSAVADFKRSIALDNTFYAKATVTGNYDHIIAIISKEKIL